jgi:hypothetical protein
MLNDLSEIRGTELDEDYNDELPRHHREHDSLPPVPDVTAETLAREQDPNSFSWTGHIWQKFCSVGPYTFSFDAWKSSIWDLFTHAGFFTYVHHDAGGYCTYAFV